MQTLAQLDSNTGIISDENECIVIEVFDQLGNHYHRLTPNEAEQLICSLCDALNDFEDYLKKGGQQ